MTTKILPGFRFAEIRYNDTLQAIAARELQDASRWPELVAINELVYPYLTGDTALASNSVKLFGQFILIPASTAQASATADPEAVYGVDIALNNGRLSLAGGGVATVGGRANLRQALGNAIETDSGELLYHPNYGCKVRELLGAVNGPTAGLLAAKYVKATILSDDRIDHVISSDAAISGDVTAITAKAVPVSGKPIDLSTSV